MGFNDMGAAKHTDSPPSKIGRAPVFIIIGSLLTVLIIYGSYATDISQHAQRFIYKSTYKIKEHMVKLGGVLENYVKSRSKCGCVNGTSFLGWNISRHDASCNCSTIITTSETKETSEQVRNVSSLLVSSNISGNAVKRAKDGINPTLFDALWDSHYINGVPVKPTEDLPRCNEFIKTLVDPVSRYLLLAMYDPGNCAEIPNPSHKFFPRLSLEDEAKEQYSQRYPQELPLMCRKTNRTFGDPNWRLCYGMPERIHYASWVDQRYVYSGERPRAQNQLGQVCFRKNLALYFLPENLNHKGGPRKVLNNLLSGLRRIGKPYIVNARMLNRFDYLFSPDPHHGFMMYYMDDKEAKAFFIGPTVISTQFTASRISSSVRRFAHVVAASKRALASNQYFPGIPLERKNAVIIPTGIDENTFKPNSNISSKGRLCLIYVKNGCDHVVLSRVEKLLSSLRIKTKKIIYGSYTEQVFRETLDKSMFAIACDGAETQGIAFQEMMSMDVPLFVINPDTVPYFSDEVGKILQPNQDVHVTLKEFIENVEIGKYKPRQWLIRNLGLAGSAINTIKTFCGIKNIWNP